MSFLKRFFGSGSEAKQLPLRLSDPAHPARSLIDAASRIADQVVEIKVVGDNTMLSTNSVTSMGLANAIDKALEKAPTDLDLMLAKSGALVCALQFKSAEDIIDQVLETNPKDFEARQRKDHWHDWQNVFCYPSWSEGNTSLHPIMSARIRHNQSVQVVRDGLQIGIAIVRPANNDFPGVLSKDIPSKWEAIWAETPFGPIVAHYTIIRDDPTAPYKAEATLPTYVPTKVTRETGYWLLQQLSRLNSCFIVIADGERVLYNRRYIFPDILKTKLKTIAQKITAEARPVDLNTFQRAVQWHMQNFDLNQIRF
jgi:hypothetical protein